MIRCANCGAEIEGTVECCPYCGALNESGAQAKYMDGLEKVRDGLEELEQLPERQYKKTLPVLFFLAAGITAAILLLAGGSGYLKRTAERAREQEYEKKAYQRAIWMDEYFPVLEEWFREGEYDKLAALYETAGEEEGSEALYNWKRYGFLSIYRPYYEGVQGVKELKEEKAGSWDIAYVLRNFLEFRYYYTGERLDEYTERGSGYGIHGITEEERLIIEKLQEKAGAILRSDFGLEPEEAEALAGRAAGGGGYLSVETIADYVEEQGMTAYFEK